MRASPDLGNLLLGVIIKMAIDMGVLETIPGNLSEERSRGRLVEISDEVANENMTKDEIVMGLIGLMVPKMGDLRQDIHTYLLLKSRWEGDFDFTKYDSMIERILNDNDYSHGSLKRRAEILK